VHFPALTGSHLSVTVVAVRPLRWVDYFTGNKTALPMAIAELGIPAVQVAPAPPAVPDACRPDLLQVDGAPVWVRLAATTAVALSGGPIGVTLCGPDAGGLVLGPGPHHVVATMGLATGIDLDQLLLDSAPGGGPMAADAPAAVVPAPTPAAPSVTVVHHGATSMDVTVPVDAGTAAAPFWLVLGESINKGWTATVSGGHSLGAPRLVDGFANGWLVTPADMAKALGPLAPGHSGTLRVALRWRPQQGVDIALVVSAAAGVLCLFLALWPRRRRSAAPPLVDDGAAAPEAGIVGAVAPTDGSGLVLRALFAAAGAGVAAGVCVAPLAGVVIAVAVVGAALVRGGRLVLAAGATGLVVATAVTMMVIEASDHLYGNGDWALHFGVANTLVWLAVALLVADLFVTGIVGRPTGDGGRVSRSRGPGPARPPDGGHGAGARAAAPAGSAPPSPPS